MLTITATLQSMELRRDGGVDVGLKVGEVVIYRRIGSEEASVVAASFGGDPLAFDLRTEQWQGRAAAAGDPAATPVEPSQTACPVCREKRKLTCRGMCRTCERRTERDREQQPARRQKMAELVELIGGDEAARRMKETPSQLVAWINGEEPIAGTVARRCTTHVNGIERSRRAKARRKAGAESSAPAARQQPQPQTKRDAAAKTTGGVAPTSLPSFSQLAAGATP